MSQITIELIYFTTVYIGYQMKKRYILSTHLRNQYIAPFSVEVPLPPPVGIITIIGLLPLMIASIAACCAPWKFAWGPMKFCSFGWISIVWRCCHCPRGSGWILRDGWWQDMIAEVDSKEPKPISWCQAWLQARKYSRWLAVSPDRSVISRAYIMPATCEEWPGLHIQSMFELWLCL